MAGREANIRPRTHRLLVHSFKSVIRRIQVNSDHSWVENRYSHRCFSRVTIVVRMALVCFRRVVRESFRAVDIQVELFSVRPAQVCKGLELHVILPGVVSELCRLVGQGVHRVGSISVTSQVKSPAKRLARLGSTYFCNHRQTQIPRDSKSKAAFMFCTI